MSFAGLLNQTAQIENRSGVEDLHGQPSFSTPRMIKVRAERTNRTIATATRENMPIDIKFFLMPSEVANLNDRITYQGGEYRIMMISPIILGNGKIHHQEVLANDWSYLS